MAMQEAEEERIWKSDAGEVERICAWCGQQQRVQVTVLACIR